MRRSLWKYQLLRKARSRKRSKLFLPVSKASSVHLIFQTGNETFFSAVKELEKLLTGKGLKVCKTAWKDTHKKQEFAANEGFTLLTSRDFNMLHWPKSLKLIPCLRLVSDYLIYIGNGNEEKLLSLAALSPVKCRIGPDGDLGREIFDICYQMEERTKGEEMADEIMRILNMIKNNG